MPKTFNREKYRRLQTEEKNLHAALMAVDQRRLGAMDRANAMRGFIQQDEQYLEPLDDGKYIYQMAAKELRELLAAPKFPAKRAAQGNVENLVEAMEEREILEREHEEASERWQRKKRLVGNIDEFLVKKGLKHNDVQRQGVV